MHRCLAQTQRQSSLRFRTSSYCNRWLYAQILSINGYYSHESLRPLLVLLVFHLKECLLAVNARLQSLAMEALTALAYVRGTHLVGQLCSLDLCNI